MLLMKPPKNAELRKRDRCPVHAAGHVLADGECIWCGLTPVDPSVARIVRRMARWLP